MSLSNTEIDVYEAKLTENQTGYDVIGDFIKRYWRRNVYADVVFSVAVSYDGIDYRDLNEVATPLDYLGSDVEFLSDWWEGEKFIKLFGIRAVDDLDIRGGIYKYE